MVKPEQPTIWWIAVGGTQATRYSRMKHRSAQCDLCGIHSSNYTRFTEKEFAEVATCLGAGQSLEELPRRHLFILCGSCAREKGMLW